jgi:hypothetical protein
MMEFVRHLGMVRGGGSSGGGGGNSGTVEKPTNDENDDNKRTRIKRKAKSFFDSTRQASLWPELFSFGFGYLLAVRVTKNSMIQQSARYATTGATTAVVTRSRQTVILSALLVAMVGREVWRSIPVWLKRQIPFVNRNQRKQAANDNGTSAPIDPSDMTSVTNIAAKLQALSAVACKKLASPLAPGAVQAAFVALIQLVGQLKTQRPDLRDTRYSTQEKQVDQAALDGLDLAFEFADFAYDELPDDQTLKEALAEADFTLIRHDANVLPGSVAHYVAISKKQKVALVGVKGTSSFEDLLTDCCGTAITHELQGPFVEGGATEIRCHEGAILAAQRLADDLDLLVEELLLPSGYKLVITGHSLGAGVAALVSVILRSRFPALLKDNGDILKVLAFASPPVLDYDNAVACFFFCTTIVNNSDIIPRASLSNLVVMLEFLKTLNAKMEAKGVNPKDLDSTASFLRMLTTSQGGDMIMSAEEVGAAMDKAYEAVELRDPDHLYVPGKVIHMYDLWSKDEAAEVDAKLDEVAREANATLAEEALEEIRSAERIYVADGASNLLRYIEIDARMLTDHLSPAYRSSIKALLSTQTSAV